MTPASFRLTAKRIAGPRWRTKLGPMIGKCRTQVWEYANGKRGIPETVEKLMTLLSGKHPIRPVIAERIKSLARESVE